MIFSTTASQPAAATDEFLRDVLDGLSHTPKQLPCKYFYDAQGSELFDQICELEEYYPTRCEAEVLRHNSKEIADFCGPHCALIEYGSGSSNKTRLLLDQLHAPAAYIPVDISGEHLHRSARRLIRLYPDLTVKPVVADFTQPFNLPSLPATTARRVVFFSGSTIGNFLPEEAISLLAHIADLVGPGGGLLIGVDLKKSQHILERAYNDRRGVTAEFNLNLLVRINRELGADFALNQFRHCAVYNKSVGRIEMNLVSLIAQAVRISGFTVEFAARETICTEYSYKYDVDQFRTLAGHAGFALDQVWTDADGLYSVQYLSVRDR